MARSGGRSDLPQRVAGPPRPRPDAARRDLLVGVGVELAQLEPKLLERLQETLAETAPAALRFAPGKLPERSSEEMESRPRRGREPTTEERELAAALAAGIEEENLRKVVAKAALASLARAD